MIDRSGSCATFGLFLRTSPPRSGRSSEQANTVRMFSSSRDPAATGYCSGQAGPVRRADRRRCPTPATERQWPGPLGAMGITAGRLSGSGRVVGRRRSGRFLPAGQRHACRRDPGGHAPARRHYRDHLLGHECAGGRDSRPGICQRRHNRGGAGPYLLDLDLTTDITHTFPGDLEITLTSPAGTTVVITTDNGGGSNDVFAGTLWDDQAGQPATDFAYSDGIVASPLVPEQALSPFIGEDPNGTWTLDIIDDEGADLGTLNSWTLDVTTIPAAPDAIALIFTNDTATTIPDGPGSTVLSNLVVGGLGNHVCDITMTTDITHTFPGDLDITLTSPAGTTQVITTDNGGANDNVFSGTVWTDDGTPATDFAYANLTTASPLAPEGAFGGFHSEDPTGTWTLSITDDAGLDTGTLNDWSLTMATCSAALPEARPVPTFGPLGLIALMLVVAIAGLVVLRRHM